VTSPCKRAPGLPIFAFVVLLALVVALVVALPGAAAAADAHELVDRVLATYGGRDKLKAVRSLHATGTTSSIRTGTSGRSERWFAEPDRLRIDIAYSPTYNESRILNGAQSWKDGVPANEPFRAAMALQAARFRLPLILVERPVRDAGEVGDMGRLLRVLAVDLGGGMSLEVAIDPASGHIEQSRGIVAFGGRTMEFATRYADFRKVGDVLFPHREQHFAMGMQTGETVLSRIDVNPAVPENIFRP